MLGYVGVDARWGSKLWRPKTEANSYRWVARIKQHYLFVVPQNEITKVLKHSTYWISSVILCTPECRTILNNLKLKFFQFVTPPSDTQLFYWRIESCDLMSRWVILLFKFFSMNFILHRQVMSPVNLTTSTTESNYWNNTI